MLTCASRASTEGWRHTYRRKPSFVLSQCLPEKSEKKTLSCETAIARISLVRVCAFKVLLFFLRSWISRTNRATLAPLETHVKYYEIAVRNTRNNEKKTTKM